MLFAAIDIGSNAARLLFANAYNKNGSPHVEKASIIRIPTRLGEDVYNNKIIGPEKTQDFIKTMKAFKLLIDVYKPYSYRVCATAALREAENSKDIIKRVKKETGLKIKVIDGKHEADIIRVNKSVEFPSEKSYVLHMDVGGGSTELSIEKDGEFIKSKSFKVGTLRMLNGKVKQQVWPEMKSWLNEFRDQFSDFHMLGTGGNINKLCKLFGNNELKQLNIGNLEFAYKNLKSLTIEERIFKYGFRPDRADVIEPAAFIYLHVMNHLKAPYIIVPRTGLSNGIILQQYKEYLAHQKEMQEN